MILRYTNREGKRVELKAAERPITIGRGAEADVTLPDKKVSRLHCGIAMEEGVLVVRDLKSKNGTYVNGTRVEMAKLQPGDQIRVGSVVFFVEEEPSKGPETILREVADEMEQGKGYATLLREIVEEVPETPARPLPAPRSPPPEKPK